MIAEFHGSWCLSHCPQDCPLTPNSSPSQKRQNDRRSESRYTNRLLTQCLFKRGISREHQTSCNCLLNSDRRRPASFVRYYFYRHIIHSNTDARSFRCAAEAACCIAQAAIYLIDMIDRSRKVRHSSSTDLIFNGSIQSYTVIYLISQYLPPGRSSLYIFKRYFSAAAWA